MRIILTHEQTDFDGLASLLGARLLDPEALAVLPRRPNRNVRAFLNIYGADLPFVDPKDLPNEKIDLIYLVDTQSLISVKGTHKGTRVRVIDHHQQRDDLPDTWEVTTDNTGANTTLLVEAIREQDIRLTAVQAGLLLLGIYEDTGSLTYSRTTPRDIRAAAYLLEEGASLTLVNDYLNQPLSLTQQALYDTLRQQAEHLTIHDHTIILALGDATEVDEELSSIAHKLRDLLDPDALFLLLATRGGTQMICRSTSDSIDVGQIATHFGGGGHSRAAAALIKDRSPENVRRELLAILPQHVRPPLTVADIMSRAPQVLSPDTPAEQAALLMQRYGYEGYPVVENNAIVGLLTRRAVDRALAHKLNLTAASLMQAGEVHVHPDHSIEHLHRLMAETGWGQIPVVERGSHRIVGIVTRTDLIKTLNPPAKRTRPSNLAARLEEALPPARLELIRQIARLAEEQNLALYIVGGFVRDLLLNYPSLDFDLVVEGDAITLAQAVGKRFGGRVTTHRRFGTAKWLLPLPGNPNTSPPSEEMQAWLQEYNAADLPTTLDFITARTEFYTHPTALPTVERGSIKLDLHRRDFTINTLALRLDGPYYGRLYDYWGGLADLEKGYIRVLHSLSFVDDPTRMLRAVRYEQRYGFTIRPRTLQLMEEALPLMKRVSGDRIRHELDSILSEPRAIPMLQRLKELGLLRAIHPDLTLEEWSLERIAALPTEPPEPFWQIKPHLQGERLQRALAYLFWLLPLPVYRIQGVIKRLKLPRDLAEACRSACLLWHQRDKIQSEKPSQLVERLKRVPALAIYGLYLATEDKALQQKLRAYAQTWRDMRPQTSGKDLQALGLPPGPAYKEILTRLRDAWLDGEIHSAAAEKRLLKRLLARHKKKSA